MSVAREKLFTFHIYLQSNVWIFYIFVFYSLHTRCKSVIYVLTKECQRFIRPSILTHECRAFTLPSRNGLCHHIEHSPWKKNQHPFWLFWFGSGLGQYRKSVPDWWYTTNRFLPHLWIRNDRVDSRWCAATWFDSLWRYWEVSSWLSVFW